MDIAFTTALNKILDQGLLGVVLLISMYINWKLWKDNRDLTEKWVGDLRQTRDTLTGPLESVKNTVEMLLTLMQRRT